MEGENIMDLTEHKLITGLLAAAIGFASIGGAAAADENTFGQIRAKSPAANAALIARVVVRPRIARVVVTPSPKQLASIRLERRIALESKAALAQQAGSGRSPTTGAL